MNKPVPTVVGSIIIWMFCLGVSFNPPHPLPLAVITVDTTLDSNEASYRACTSALYDCSLRGAITKSNNISGGIGYIILPADTYQLTRVGTDDNNVAGDLNITEPVTITGSGQNSTFIQAGTSMSDGIDRVFEVSSEGYVTFSDLTIRWGKVTADVVGGAGIYQNTITNSIILDRVTVTENQTMVSQSGGGVYISGSMTIQDSIISNNIAGPSGGGIFQEVGSSLVIARTSIYGNSATFGGGIANNAGATLRNVTISGNTASQAGGGIGQWNYGYLTIYNTTISNNIVLDSNTAWAVFNAHNNPYPLTGFVAHNSILTAASGKTACALAVDAGGHNIATDGSCGSGFSIVDPRLSPLTAFGSTWLHTLLLGSPGIDAGDNSSCETSDQRGITRPLDGDRNGISVCDIGAYEALPVGVFIPLMRRP